MIRTYREIYPPSPTSGLGRPYLRHLGWHRDHDVGNVPSADVGVHSVRPRDRTTHSRPEVGEAMTDLDSLALALLAAVTVAFCIVLAVFVAPMVLL